MILLGQENAYNVVPPPVREESVRGQKGGSVTIFGIVTAQFASEIYHLCGSSAVLALDIFLVIVKFPLKVIHLLEFRLSCYTSNALDIFFTGLTNNEKIPDIQTESLNTPPSTVQ